MSDHITELLNDISRYGSRATDGPWTEAPDSGENGWYWIEHVDIDGQGHDVALRVTSKSDAEFIALSRTVLPALSQAVRSVLELPTLPEDTNARYWHNMGLNRAKQTIQRHLEGANDAEKPH